MEISSLLIPSPMLPQLRAARGLKVSGTTSLGARLLQLETARSDARAYTRWGKFFSAHTAAGGRSVEVTTAHDAIGADGVQDRLGTGVAEVDRRDARAADAAPALPRPTKGMSSVLVARRRTDPAVAGDDDVVAEVTSSLACRDATLDSFLKKDLSMTPALARSGVIAIVSTTARLIWFTTPMERSPQRRRGQKRELTAGGDVQRSGELRASRGRT